MFKTHVKALIWFAIYVAICIAIAIQAYWRANGDAFSDGHFEDILPLFAFIYAVAYLVIIIIFAIRQKQSRTFYLTLAAFISLPILLVVYWAIKEAY